MAVAHGLARRASNALCRSQRHGRVVLYHAVAEPTEFDFVSPRDCVSPAAFESHLEFYHRHYDVVSLDVLVAGECDPLRALAITFDDGFECVYRNAFPLLAARKLCATVFVATDTLDGTALWNDELSCLLHRAPLRTRERLASILGYPPVDAVLPEAIASWPRQRILAVREALSDLAPPDSAAWYLTRDHLRHMRAHGITFGSHGAAHLNLTNLDGQSVRNDISRSQRALSAEQGHCDLIAFPFGYAGPREHRLARQLGFRGLLEVWGPTPHGDPSHRTRTPIRVQDPGALTMTLELWAPVKRGLMRLNAVRALGNATRPLQR